MTCYWSGLSGAVVASIIRIMSGIKMSSEDLVTGDRRW